MKYLGIALVLAGLLIGSGRALGADAGVSWGFPTNNIDGSEVTDLAGAKIYYGTVSSNYTDVIDVGMVTSTVITNLRAGVMYYFNGTAYNTAGLESDFCTEVAKMPSTRPMPLQDFEAKAEDMIAKLRHKHDNTSRWSWMKRMRLESQIDILELLIKT